MLPTGLLNILRGEDGGLLIPILNGNRRRLVGNNLHLALQTLLNRHGHNEGRLRLRNTSALKHDPRTSGVMVIHITTKRNANNTTQNGTILFDLSSNGRPLRPFLQYVQLHNGTRANIRRLINIIHFKLINNNPNGPRRNARGNVSYLLDENSEYFWGFERNVIPFGKSF